MKGTFIVSFVLALAATVHAYTYIDIQQGRLCWQSNVTTKKTGGVVTKVKTHESYAPGQTWQPGPCEECSCHAHSYRNLRSCYLPVQDEWKSVEGGPREHFITMKFGFTFGCPFGFRQVGKSREGLKAEMFLTYRTVDAVSMFCANNKQHIRKSPEKCVALPKEDGCEFDAVLKNDHSKACDEPIAIVG